MAKRAFLIGLNDYGNDAVAPLDAPVDEVRRWSNLLTGVYQFDPAHIVTRVERPTRASVINDLRILLMKAQPDDQIVFGFFGHGSLVEGHDENGTPNGILEEGLVLYNDESPSIQDSAFSSSDLISLLKESRLPAGVPFTVILDCCFAGRFGEAGNRRPGDPRPLSVSNNGIGSSPPVGISSHKALAAGSDPSGTPQHRFAWIKNPTVADSALALPIIVAASSESETAFEIGDRLLFSRRALDELARNGGESYDQFIRRLTPLEEGIPQHASLTGDLTRSSNPFLH